MTPPHFSAAVYNSDTTFSGIIYQANSGYNFAVNKVGSGTLTFSGANSYSGLTAVKSGRLLLNQNFSGAGGFTVSSGATLGITNAVPANMADLGALTLNSGATLEFQNVSNLTSALVDTTSLAVSSASIVKITGTNYFVIGSTYPLLTNSGTMSGFGNFSLQMPLGYGGTLVSNANQILLTVTLPPAPGTPLNLIATPGDAKVNLSWNSATNATGYNLKRSLTNGGPYSVIATNFAALIFTNSGLLNGTNYFYVVSSTNIAGESANSAQAVARPTSPVATNLIFNLSVGQLQLNWPADHTGWRLQTQTNSLKAGLGTNWVTVANSTNVNLVLIPMTTTNGSVFFRLVYP